MTTIHSFFDSASSCELRSISDGKVSKGKKRSFEGERDKENLLPRHEIGKQLKLQLLSPTELVDHRSSELRGSSLLRRRETGVSSGLLALAAAASSAFLALPPPSPAAFERNEQEQFFTYHEPKRWYPLSRWANGKIRIVLPLSVRKTRNLIYIFRNRVEGSLLIGETGGSFGTRMTQYLTKFNTAGSEDRVKHKLTKSFLVAVKQHPEHFDAGILYVLKSGEDIAFYEKNFIKHKLTVFKLYNARAGGGGGKSHSEEASSSYAVLKPEIAPFTPEKYYPFKKDEHGRIRPQFTPGFYERVKKSREDLGPTQAFVYAIKEFEAEERYVGVTGVFDPSTRLRQHAYNAEYFVPEHSKYDPSRKSGALHPAMAERPEAFGCGLMPVKDMAKVAPEDRDRYLFFQGISEVEKYAIRVKESLTSQHGFNCNRGGGGSIAARTTKVVRKRLDF